MVYQDMVYHIRRNLYSLDLFNWELTDYGEVPTNFRQPGRCQVADIDGVTGNLRVIDHRTHHLVLYVFCTFLTGIMLKNGYWFNLESLEWESKRFPPNPPFVPDLTDALYSFRGSPTFFGSPVCDENGECEYREVLWYDSDRDIYYSLGNMNEQRFNHEVTPQDTS